ncbi:MAG TPA: hypothetical protein VFU49_03690 [Ktedonobacteraceae bacterium]|nr:hypothetical protein [Ktedonobacteraceae bacterium]
MRKILVCRIAGLLTLLLTMAAFVVAGSPVSYAARVHRAAAIPASITVAEKPLTEDTTGSFVGTVSGRGLHSNAVYRLTDNNFQCVDSINFAGSLTVTTDIEGRFNKTFHGGPSFFGSAACVRGRYTITARLAVLPRNFLTTTFKLKSPTSFGHIASLVFNPNPAVISTNGSYVSTLYGKGWTPGRTYRVFIVTSSCSSNSGTGASPQIPFVTDGDGNFEIGIAGTGCHAGTIKVLVIVGSSLRLVTLHLAAPSR